MRRERGALGPSAAALLQNQAFRSIVAECRETIVKAWEIADTAAEREAHHAELQALRRVGQVLNALATEKAKG